MKRDSISTRIYWALCVEVRFGCTHYLYERASDGYRCCWWWWSYTCPRARLQCLLGHIISYHLKRALPLTNTFR